MPVEDLLNLPLHFTPAFVRIAGVMFFAPLIGASQMPRRLRFMLAGLLAIAMAGAAPAPQWPASDWQLALGLGGELLFGLAMGLLLSLVFMAARFAGALAGQQMGFNLGGSFDPTTEIGSNPLGDVYFILCMFLFLMMDGHHAMMLGIRNSFDYLPPLSIAIDANLLDVLSGMVMSATTLAVRVAAPVCVAMLVVDLALGMIGRTIPQMNLMSVGLSLRSLAGLAIVILGLGLTATVLSGAISDGLTLAEQLWLPAGQGAITPGAGA